MKTLVKTKKVKKTTTREYYVEVKTNMNCEDDAPGGFFKTKKGAMDYIKKNKKFFLDAQINGIKVDLKKI